jgi:hypothetical protein
MSTNIPPNPNVDTFNTLYWKTGTGTLTIEEADLRYLKFPVAQGTENLQTTNVNGVLTANAGVKTNIIEAKTGAPGNRIDIGKTRFIGAVDCNSNAFTNFKSFQGSFAQTIQFIPDTGYNLEIFGNIDMINSNITNINILSNNSPSGLIIENLQDVDMTFKTNTVTRLEIGTTIKAYVDMYMNNNSIYDTIRLQNSSLVNNLLIQSLNLPIAFEYLSLNKLTISADILLGTNLNCQNFHIINAEHVNGISDNNFPIRAVGTGHLQLFAGGTNRLTFRDTNECLANSNGLYIQGTTNTTSKVRLGYNGATITQGDGSISIGGGCGTNQGTGCIAIGQGAGVGTTIAQGTDSIAIGTNSGVTSQGAKSIAIGNLAGQTNQALNHVNVYDGSIAIGHSAGRTGQFKQSIAIGNLAADQNQASGWSTSGDGSIAIGTEAGRYNQARRAVALGGGAGVGTSSPLRSQGEASVCIGYAAGYTGIGANTIAIGNTCCSNTPTLANSIVLSAWTAAYNPATSGFFINPNNVVIGATGNALTYNQTTGEIVRATSSARYKKDIEPLLKDTNVLHSFKPVEFRYLAQDETQTKQYGFIAEDMDLIDKDLVVYNEEGLPDGIYWDKINTYNICEVQKLRTELDGTVNIMRVMLDDMKAMKDEMELMRNELNLLKGSSPQI